MKILMDVDCGVDDAHAIMLALGHPNVELLGITCVNGNTGLDNVCRNTLRVLKLCGRLDIPVYRGSQYCLLGRQCVGTDFHGVDGLGDTETDYIDTSLVQEEHAVNALVRIVNENKGEVNLMATAPLTNIALALRLDPAFGKKLKSATIMGGNVEGQGNYKISGEFNFVSDPEAAYIVLNELKCPINLLCLEPSLRHGISMDWVDYWIEIDTKRGRFNKRITGKLLQNMVEETLGENTFVLYDAFAVITLLNPDSVLETTRKYCTVELHGNHTRGMMLVDWHGHLGQEPNVNILKRINMECVIEALEESMLAVDDHEVDEKKIHKNDSHKKYNVINGHGLTIGRTNEYTLSQ